MAHVVPKREPCKKCNLPVFLAERLVIGQVLFHRICLKCARCDSQLTVGNFYETENDNEYCCETCPDEEKEKTKSEEGMPSTRMSLIAQRVQMFEKDTSVLKKSLSDEEKTKSLQRQKETVESFNITAPAHSKALNSFLAAQLDNADQVDDITKLNEVSGESDSDSDEENENVEVCEGTPEIKVNNIEPDDKKILENLNLSHDNSDKIEIIKHIEESDVQETISDSFIFTKEQIDEIQSSSDVPPSVEEPSTNPEILQETSVPPVITVEAQKDEDNNPENNQEKIANDNQNITTNPEIATEPEEIQKPETEQKLEPVEEIEIKKEDTTEVPDLKVTDETEIKTESVKTVAIKKSNPKKKEYPDNLNPFGSEDEDVDDAEQEKIRNVSNQKSVSMNPFGSCSEDEEDTSQMPTPSKRTTLPKPPRPPPPKIKTVSTNPFDDDTDDEKTQEKQDSSKSTPVRTPVPTPRKTGNSTPEPTPRMRSNTSTLGYKSPAYNYFGSTTSLASSNEGGTLARRRKGKAPPPPSTSATQSPASKASPSNTLQSNKKKRLAPTPPTSAQKSQPHNQNQDSEPSSLNTTVNSIDIDLNESKDIDSTLNKTKLRLIPLEQSLIDDDTHNASLVNGSKEEEQVTFRRKIVPLSPDSTINEDSNSWENNNSHGGSERQWEKMKDNKEAQNRNRQSQISLTSQKSESHDMVPYILNKSSHGKWKRRKGPAPQIPLPQKKVLQMLPLQEIRHELEVIEVQQQGLEKQGVQLEKMIRERCEGPEEKQALAAGQDILEALPTKNTKEVEDLIMQLFELVNEKNELFRRQAELMYLRRMHRLEQEQADIEYEIRLLMAQPECNKTDSDKAREEALIARMVEVVQLRNEVVDCLEMDRIREAEEDMSIKQRMEMHTAKRDEELINQTPTKLSKKEKKKQKEAKKLLKNKKLDADKDTDDTELKPEVKEKKKKKKFLF